MVEKTKRMLDIEAMLADEPNDAFLRYALAMEYSGKGDDATAAQMLRELIAIEPYVPAFLMGGQAYGRLGKVNDAMAMLRQGIAEAKKQNNLHAMGEMQGLLDTLD